jgi:hypothetical protein
MGVSSSPENAMLPFGSTVSTDFAPTVYTSSGSAPTTFSSFLLHICFLLLLLLLLLLQVAQKKCVECAHAFDRKFTSC